VLGPLHAAVAEEVGLTAGAVVAPACHDTASAAFAVPAEGQEYFFLSSGTWSALGAVISEPVITEQSLNDNFTNESGVGGKYLFRKNIMGLWLLQECRRTWSEMGEEVDYDRLISLAERAAPFGPMVEPDHESFLQPGDMVTRIQAFCKDTGQEAPGDIGAITRCIFESLALKYRWVFDRTEASTGKRADVVHVVGGGSKNAMLCQLTANALGRRVAAGPSEATTIGNVLVQALAGGRISDENEARNLVRQSFDLQIYEPQESDRWEAFYRRFLDLKEHSTTLL
jgi:rhamnulokinase